MSSSRWNASQAKGSRAGQDSWHGFLEEIEDRGREQMVMGLLDPQSFPGSGAGE